MTNWIEENTTETKKTNVRGFAGFDEARRKEIASKGGKAAHAMGRAHRFTHEEARVAGQKGGRARTLRHDLQKPQEQASA